MYPTVAEVLTLPVLQRGGARTVAGTAGTGNRVRWVHVAEVADIAPLLRGGELVLTTGIALPESAEALTRYVEDLVRVGVAGLVVELVRRWQDRLPEALTQAAERHGLPVVTLTRETRYVTVSEAVIAMIVAAQVAELRAAEQVHEAFNALTVAGAEPRAILAEVARMSGLPVVLETLTHHVLAYDAAGNDPTELLADWERRSRAARVPGRTSYDAVAGWLVTTVGARGDDWGRLILVSAAEPPHRHVVVAERAASALALYRLATRDRESLERQTHRVLLSSLLTPGPPAADLAARATALGVPLDGRQLVGVAVRPHMVPTATHGSPAPALAVQELLRDLAEATAAGARRAGVNALVGVVDDTSARALLTLPGACRGADVEALLHRVAREIHHAARTSGSLRDVPVAIAVGTTVDTAAEGLAAARRSLREAAHVATAALQSATTGADGGQPPTCYRLADVRLRGLLHLLADDERLAAFVDRELGPLLARERDGARLLEVLRGYCEHGGNKSAAAAAAHTSRTAYYQQLARIEQILGVRLQEPESMLSLHVALLAWEAGRTVR